MKRAFLVAVALALIGAIGCSEKPQETPMDRPDTSWFEEPSEEAPRPADAPEAAEKPRVALETTKGGIVLELWPDKAPETVANFLQYVDDEFYDGTIFHRVIANFMIQGGGFTADMRQKPTRAPVQNEARADAPNARGTIAMARTGEPHSATAQFFINVVDNRNLNFRAPTREGFGYCVFGEVVEGMEAVDAIRNVRTGTAGHHQNVPAEPVVIRRARRVEVAQ